MKIIVGIILYNPNIDVVKKNIMGLFDVADEIILIDNGSKNIKNIEMGLRGEKIKLIKNEKNLGVAKALNEILDYTNKLSADYLLTLDQDSKLKSQDVEKMLQYVGPDIAIVCPRMIDINKSKQKKYKSEIETVGRCITSGSLMNMAVCNKVGAFDDVMFIDYVDFEYCKRIRLAGYKIVRINSVDLVHEIGKRTNRRFLWKKVYPTNHNASRVYYYVRNIYYYLWKFRKELTTREKTRERILLLWKYFSIILYEDNKRIKLQSFMRGRKDGKNGLKRAEAC